MEGERVSDMKVPERSRTRSRAAASDGTGDVKVRSVNPPHSKDKKYILRQDKTKTHL